jgi:AraC-like DNA-binding protein
MREPGGRPEAIVRPNAARQAFVVERIEPTAALKPFIDYYWLVRWQVPVSHKQQVVPQPRVHIAAEKGRLLIHGVSRTPFFRTLTGTGHVLGAAFHAGGFRPFYGSSVGSISGAVRPAGEVLGIDDRDAAGRILQSDDSGTMVNALETYLLAAGPCPDPVGTQVTELVAIAQRRTDITRVELLAEVAGMNLRSLQRLFTEYVGVGPKWVIQRFRILDAVAAAHADAPTDWAALASELGFSDQAHLTRVFTHVIGTPPASYRRDPGTAG